MKGVTRRPGTRSQFGFQRVCQRAALLVFCAVSTLGFSGPMSAQQPGSPPGVRLTLDQALQQALKQHPSLQRAGAQTGVAAARASQARAGMMPSIVLQGTATDGPLG